MFNHLESDKAHRPRGAKTSFVELFGLIFAVFGVQDFFCPEGDFVVLNAPCPQSSVSDLPFPPRQSWELVCLRNAPSLSQTLPRYTGPGPQFCNELRNPS